MGNKQVLMLGGITAGLLIILAIITLLPVNEAEEEVGEEDLPSYVQLEASDTYYGDFEIAGQWILASDRRQDIRFSDDGTYVANGDFSPNGTFEIGDGYVTLKCSLGYEEILRVVCDNEGEIILQRDYESLPKRYMREENLPEEDLSEYGAEDDETQRFAISMFKQILEKSQWTVESAEVETAKFEKNSISFLSNGEDAGTWQYGITAASINENSYDAQMTVEGKDYSAKITWKGDYGSEGYILMIGDSEAPLLMLESNSQVDLEQPS